MDDYYNTLNVSKNATSVEIKKSYHAKAKLYHPDRIHQNENENAIEEFKKIQNAYAVLSDPDKRKMYNLTCLEHSVHSKEHSRKHFKEHSRKHSLMKSIGYIFAGISVTCTSIGVSTFLMCSIFYMPYILPIVPSIILCVPIYSNITNIATFFTYNGVKYGFSLIWTGLNIGFQNIYNRLILKHDNVRASTNCIDEDWCII